MSVNLKKPPAASENGQPPPKASVIKRLEGAEETSHERLVRKHVPAWVVSGAIHVGIIAIAILIFGTQHKVEAKPDKVIMTSVEKEDDAADKDLTNEDPGLQSDLMAALPDIERVDEKNVDAAVTNDTLGQPNSEMNDTTAYAPPGLTPSDSPNAGVSGEGGNFKGGDGGAAGMMSAGFPGRSGATKSRLIAEGGGNEASELAVARGLAWLARQQQADGSWHFDGSHKTDVVAATGLSLLPFLAAGQTHKTGKYQQHVYKGLNYLVRNIALSGNNPGKFTGSGTMYTHGIASIALCEAYGMTKDKAFLLGPAQAAINYINKAQGPDGGWRYQPGQPGDTSVVGWQVQALKAAALSKDIIVDDKVVRRAIDFLNKVGKGESSKSAYGYTDATSARPGTSCTSVGLLCRYYIDGWGPANGGMADGVLGLMKNGPKPKTPLGDMYYFYYATQVVHFFEGPEWKAWNEGPEVNGKREGGMRDWLISLQQTKDGANYGSWDPDRGHMGSGSGRLGTTCMVLLTLEVYYRHLPLYKRDTGGVKILDGIK